MTVIKNPDTAKCRPGSRGSGGVARRRRPPSWDAAPSPVLAQERRSGRVACALPARPWRATGRGSHDTRSASRFWGLAWQGSGRERVKLAGTQPRPWPRSPRGPHAPPRQTRILFNELDVSGACLFHFVNCRLFPHRRRTAASPCPRQGKFASFLELCHVSENRLCGVLTQIA